MKQDTNRQTENSTIKKTMRYTVRKILWLVNYSLSFSKEDTGKEIGIKILGCIVILQSVSLLFVIVSSVLGIIFTNPLFTIGLLILIGAFLFKKEIKLVLKSSKSGAEKKQAL